MSDLVWDASAVVKLVVQEPGSAQAGNLFAGESTHHLLDWTALEVGGALWKRTQRSGTDRNSALRAFDAFGKLDFELTEGAAVAEAAFGLALLHRHPIYDCAYVALALEAEASLVTADARMRHVAESAGIEVVWIESS